MADQKIDNLLNLAMDATPQERRKSGNLNVGYDPATRLWDVIIKYSGPESGLAGNGIQVVPLLGGYAVVTLPESEIDKYSHRAQVEFMEKPKRLYFELFQAKGVSCIRTVQTGRDGLTGKGILIGIVDSGVDYYHTDFRNADGSSRILRLWDQSIPGKPPQGYVTGTEYTKEEIDEALALGENQGRRLVPSVDYSGHGTSVLGIAAGNGRASDGVNQGVAYESDLIVVKMGIPRENSFPRTTELIQGIDYLVRQSLSLGRPIAINISFGNNYGSQIGKTLMHVWGKSVTTRACARAAAGSDARMGGCSMPVVINSGSGNQGMTVSLPVIVFADEWEVSHEKLCRSLVVSNLIAIHQKYYIGSLSAYCGAVSAACGAGAGITYMYGGTYQQVSLTIINTLGNVGGIVCDGAKPSCAAKIASSVDAALMAFQLSIQNKSFLPGEGIIKDDIEETIKSMGYIGRVGMRSTDTEILNVMIDRADINQGC